MRGWAKAIGVLVFLAVLLPVGGIALAFLSIRSPLADGTIAPGPDPAAYAILLIVVGLGALAIGWAAALLADRIMRK